VRRQELDLGPHMIDEGAEDGCARHDHHTLTLGGEALLGVGDRQWAAACGGRSMYRERRGAPLPGEEGLRSPEPLAPACREEDGAAAVHGSSPSAVGAAISVGAATPRAPWLAARKAISSAAIATPISAGLRAPTSTPTGIRTRAMSAF